MINERNQRYLAVGLLLLVLTVFCVAVLGPLFNSGFAYYNEKKDLMFRLQRQQKIAARKDSINDSLAAVKQQFQQQGFFSNRDTEALASADLQNIVKTAVTDAGGQLTSTQGLPGKIDNGFTRVAVRVRMTGSMETLRAVLRAFAKNVPLLIVDQIDIVPMRAAQRRVSPNNNISPTAQLNVSFQVVSFMRGAKT